MLSIVDIKKEIVSRLKTLGINIVANDIKSGFKKPAFFIQIMPIGEETNNDISTNTLIINIHYFSDDKTDLDNLKMLDKLRKIFINKINVDSRVLTISNKRYDIDENVLQFMFDIRYTEEVHRENVDVYDLIGDMQFKVN